MYTQCPDCREAFHVTAEILQQAGGRVRCGACGHAFDALDGLSEAPPPYAGEPDDAEESAFRNVLEELGDTGNVRLEDTGVEWRLVEEENESDDAEEETGDDSTGASALRWFIQDDPEEPGNDPVIPEAGARARQERLELETPTLAPAAHEERYDDHTPIAGLLDEDDDVAPAIAETPRRRAEDFIEPRTSELDERQVDLALGEPEEWTDLLREVGDGDDAGSSRAADARPGVSAGVATDASHAAEVDEDPTAEHPVLDAGELTLVEEDAPAATPEWMPAEESEEELGLVDELVGEAEADSADATGELEPLAVPPDAGEPREPARGAGAAHAVVPPTEEEMTIDRLIDEDLLRLTGEQEALGAPPPGPRGPVVPQHVETIVMEGEFVQSSLSGEIAAPEPAGERPLEEAGPLKDTYIRSRDAAETQGKTRSPARYSGLAAAALLVLLLAGQLVHAYRETLATWPVFDGTVGAVYRRLGAPITPGWDVNGWQVQSTTGSTDASGTALTIASRVTNRSERALPYPLLHVTLTDRYEEVVGSTLLAPEQYLAIRSARGMVDPGENFNATVTIAPLAAAAEGFKLNVCYAMVDDDVRCAKGAFKGD